MEDNMPIVIIEWNEDRTLDQKKQFAKGITSAFVKIGTSAEDVKIIMNDNPAHNYFSGGKN